MVHFWSSNMAHDPCRCHQVSCCGHRPGALLHLDPDQCEVPRGIAMAALEGVDFQGVPSGKHTKNYGKSPFLMGKSTIMAIFNSKLLVYRRVYLQQKKGDSATSILDGAHLHAEEFGVRQANVAMEIHHVYQLIRR